MCLANNHPALISEPWRGLIKLRGLLYESHLRCLMREYVAYYHEDRPHLSLCKQPPDPRPTNARASPDDRVVAFPRLGGLHHRYEWKAAA